MTTVAGCVFIGLTVGISIFLVLLVADMLMDR